MDSVFDVSSFEMDQLVERLTWLALAVRVKFKMDRVIAIAEEYGVAPQRKISS